MILFGILLIWIYLWWCGMHWCIYSQIFINHLYGLTLLYIPPWHPVRECIKKDNLRTLFSLNSGKYHVIIPMNLEYCMRIILVLFFAKHSLLQLFQQEKARAMLNELVGKLTSVCWDKCIGTPGSKISSSESSCLTNCAQQFMETSALILRRFGGAPQWRKHFIDTIIRSL